MDEEQTRVLIIEDEPELLELLAAEISSAGFDVITAENGDQGLRKAVAERPTIALCDIMMPIMDGYEFLRRVRVEHPELDMMPVMFLTAKGDQKDVMTALALGVDDYITKPFDFGLLIAQIWSRVSQIQRITSYHDSQLVKVYRRIVDSQERQERGPSVSEVHSSEESAKTAIAVCAAEASERKAIVDAAQHAGYACYESDSGESLLKDLSDIQPEILFLSYRTSDVAGFYLATQLKEVTDGNLPIIFLAGNETPITNEIQVPRSYDDYLNVPEIEIAFPELLQKWSVKASKAD